MHFKVKRDQSIYLFSNKTNITKRTLVILHNQPNTDVVRTEYQHLYSCVVIKNLWAGYNSDVTQIFLYHLVIK